MDNIPNGMRRLDKMFTNNIPAVYLLPAKLTCVRGKAI